MNDLQNQRPPTDATPEGEHGQPDEDQQDLTIFVQNLLTQMQSRFQQMSEAIITRIDDMGNRIDGLEKSIGELMAQAGVEEMEGSPAVPESSENLENKPGEVSTSQTSNPES
mmetsp:Transcript_15284/g.18917  ORF Transcript_15284/g.18917 Transcript_15284/m.18917 type:complete len:112 (+) Transcript_15284:233-568(+)|eukprot:CAMPEP_0204849356 /NCGR_PEP_ID=MMETSP1347-20130617/6146_1 /ASSEMBLY_ACC=CAM_ASM_000690 /TAXON_ID=215587 /ORGANISM="Aplanochytrium stocchinoi, Strain GSBS06" /LENGTH=111 /DNA_ID=CAMNT_0051991627 /DNA_START=65 /DNA_END=400 /DNA_ORIENTATION=-